MIHESINRDDGRYWDSTGITHYGNLLCDILFPIGFVYISTKNTNPGVFFGGTWQQIYDVFPLFCGPTFPAGSVGGEATHKLTISEMPNHDHDAINFCVGYTQSSEHTDDFQTLLHGNESSWSFPAVRKSGGSQPHNNMPPYKAFYAWERVA